MSRIQIGMLCAAALVAAFMLGRWTKLRSAESGEIISASGELRDEGGQGAMNQIEERFSAVGKDVDHQARFLDCLDEDDSLAVLAIGEWTLEDPLAALGAIEEVADAHLVERLRTAVMGTWAANDPAAVLDFFTELEEGRHLDEWLEPFSAAVEVIAYNSPELAFEMLLPSYQGSNQWVSRQPVETLFGVWAKSDPLAATEQARAIVNVSVRMAALSVVGAEIASVQGFPGSLEWMESMELSAHVRERVIGSLANDWVQEDRESLLEAARLQEVGDPVGSVLAEVLLNGCGASEIDLVLELLPSVKYPDELLEGLVGRFPPADTAKILETQIGGENKWSAVQLAENLGGRWGREDPQAAMNWALSLPAGPARVEALGTTLAVWVQEDQQVAIDAMRSIPGGDGSDAEAVAAGVRLLAKKDVDLARDVLSQLPREFVGEARVEVIKRLELAEAIEFVDALPAEAPGRESAYGAVVGNWYKSNDADEVTEQARATVEDWLGQIRTEPGGAEAYRAHIQQLIFMEPRAASEWLVDVPLGVERDAATVELTEWLLERDAAAALRWAGEIGDVDERERLERSAGEHLRQVDPDRE